MTKQDIIKAKKYISLLEKYTGKKVILKETTDLEKEQVLNMFNFIVNGFSILNKKVEELWDSPNFPYNESTNLGNLSSALSDAEESLEIMAENIEKYKNTEGYFPSNDTDDDDEEFDDYEEIN